MTQKLFNQMFAICSLPFPAIILQKKQLTDKKIKTGDFQEQGRGLTIRMRGVV